MFHCFFRKFVLALLALLTAHIPALPTDIPAKTPKASHKMQIVWSDDFNGSNVMGPDPALWEPRVTDQWQNSAELQNYTANLANASLTGTGMLRIRAIREASGDKQYSSARFRATKSFLYGLFEAHIQVPVGVGIWPAWWLIGPDASMGWPACGEIDIMEAPSILGQAQTIHAGTHTPSASNSDVPVGITPVSLTPLLGTWHTYAVDWQRDYIEWLIDGKPVGHVSRVQVEAAGGKWVLNALPQTPVLNLAVGGWAGTPDTWSQQDMLVDYVRVWQ